MPKLIERIEEIEKGTGDLAEKYETLYTTVIAAIADGILTDEEKGLIRKKFGSFLSEIASAVMMILYTATMDPSSPSALGGVLTLGLLWMFLMGPFSKSGLKGELLQERDERMKDKKKWEDEKVALKDKIDDLRFENRSLTKDLELKSKGG